MKGCLFLYFLRNRATLHKNFFTERNARHKPCVYSSVSYSSFKWRIHRTSEGTCVLRLVVKNKDWFEKNLIPVFIFAVSFSADCRTGALFQRLCPPPGPSSGRSRGILSSCAFSFIATGSSLRISLRSCTREISRGGITDSSTCITADTRSDRFAPLGDTIILSDTFAPFPRDF